MGLIVSIGREVKPGTGWAGCQFNLSHATGRLKIKLENNPFSNLLNTYKL